MQDLARSTAETRALRGLGWTTDIRFVNWATTMLQHGHSSDALCALAGAVAPFEPTKLVELIDECFGEFSLAIPATRDEAVVIWATVRVQDALEGRQAHREVLEELADLYWELEYPAAIYDFYLLAWAARDLDHEPFQRHWPDATRDSIDDVIAQRFRQWVCEHPIPE